MAIKHIEIEVVTDDPFKNCKLGRKKYAEVLTDIVRTYPDGFILAINNEWGTGKTTFIKMWQQHLINLQFRTVYYNAWENDFESSPLVAIISELKAITGKGNEHFKSLLRKAATFSKALIPSIAKAVADRYIKSDVLTDSIKNAMDGATEILDEEINKYTTRKEKIKDFRKELEKFSKESENKLPIIFIIDELDRCRPNYAVEVLEQVKHLFSVPGFVFVLSIDKIQLGHAIKGVYGSEQIDAEEYLRRFIDLEYSLPRPDTKQLSEYFYDYFKFNDFFWSDSRKIYVDFKNDGLHFITFAQTLFEKKNITIRQQEKLFAHAKVALASFEHGSYVLPTIFLLLIYLRTFYPELYRKIETKSISTQELLEDLYEALPKDIDKDFRNFYINMEATLTYLYYRYQNRGWRDLITKNEQDGKVQCIIKSKLDTSVEQHNFVQFINEITQHLKYSAVQLEDLLNRINLTETLTIQKSSEK